MKRLANRPSQKAPVASFSAALAQTKKVAHEP